MAGTPRGSIEHYISSSAAAYNQDIFIATVLFLENHPSWTSISSQGNGATGAPSTWNYTSNRPGENSFAVFQNAGGWFLLVQWSYASNFGVSPGDPGDHPAGGTSGYYNGIQMAFDTSGGTGIWNGGTGNVSADSKGSPVWVNDGGQVVVYPRANGNGGTFAAAKEACAAQTNNGNPAGATPGRFQIIGDEDYVWWGWDHGNGGSYDICCYCGPFTPDPEVTITGDPLCMFSQNGSITFNGGSGTLTNTNLTSEGGLIAAVGQSQARIFRTSLPNTVDWFGTTYQPNSQRAPASHDELSIPLILNDADGSGSYGYVGKIELVKAAFNLPTHDTNGDATKAFFGTSTAASIHWVVDWDGTTVPGSGSTREGVQFP
jgi:hypothetical protein